MVNKKGLRSITTLHRAIGPLVIIFALMIAIGTSTQAQTANITLGVITVPERSTGTVSVSVNNGGSGLSDFQGKLIYDPSVVSVREVNGLSGYTIAAFQIDNFAGEARFIGFKSSGQLINDGEFLQFTLESVGSINSSSALDMEFITFNDSTGQITHIVTPGRFTVGARSQLVADFSFSPANPEINQEITFTDQSRGGSESFDRWFWDFGDETTSTEQNPTHTFTGPGNFTVSLTVVDSVGTEATTTQTVTILPPGGASQISVHNYPNPASESTTFSYFVPLESTQALLSIYAFTGPLVFSAPINIRNLEYTWDLKDQNDNDVPNGIYLYRIWASTPEGARLSNIGKLVIER